MLTQYHMSPESMSNLGEFEEQLSDDYQFPEEYQQEKNVPYAKVCADRAKKAEYYRIDDMPVAKLFSSDGTYSYTYGYKDGVWSINNVGNESLYNDGAKIRRNEFMALYESEKRHS